MVGEGGVAVFVVVATDVVGVGVDGVVIVGEEGVAVFVAVATVVVGVVIFDEIS